MNNPDYIILPKLNGRAEIRTVPELYHLAPDEIPLAQYIPTERLFEFSGDYWEIWKHKETNKSVDDVLG